MKKILLLITASFISIPFILASVSLPSIDQVNQQIQHRRGSWIVLQADVGIHFVDKAEQNGICQGTLSYHRLDEKLVVDCHTPLGKHVFGFKAEDRDFELYLPSNKTVYYGNIFDLQDSPDIESHLKPLDLYRALKPGFIPKNQIEIEELNDQVLHLKIFDSLQSQQTYLSREALLTKEGDIVEELFMNFKSEPLTKIQRADYRKISEGNDAAYPHQVMIDDLPDERKTTIAFSEVYFASELDESHWHLNIPYDTKKVYLESSA